MIQPRAISPGRSETVAIVKGGCEGPKDELVDPPLVDDVGSTSSKPAERSPGKTTKGNCELSRLLADEDAEVAEHPAASMEVITPAWVVEAASESNAETSSTTASDRRLTGIKLLKKARKTNIAALVSGVDTIRT